jgi:hypothetical protein
MYTQEAIFEALQHLPYPDPLSKAELVGEGIRFYWRGSIFRVSLDTAFVEECDNDPDPVLRRSNLALLMEALLFTILK